MSLFIFGGLAVAAAIVVLNKFNDDDENKRMEPVRVRARNSR